MKKVKINRCGWCGKLLDNDFVPLNGLAKRNAVAFIDHREDYEFVKVTGLCCG